MLTSCFLLSHFSIRSINVCVLCVHARRELVMHHEQLKMLKLVLIQVSVFLLELVTACLGLQMVGDDFC